MRYLLESPFLVCVRESIETSQAPAPDVLTARYVDFSAAFASAVEGEDSILSLFRNLRLLHIEIRSCLRRVEICALGGGSLLVSLLWKSLETVDVELDVVRMKIDHYGLSPKPDGSPRSLDGSGSPGSSGIPAMFWSKDFTVTDLMELIVALCESGAVVWRDGSRVSLAALVRLFERMFNIEIKDPRGLKANVTTRKIKAISFLNVLSENFMRLRNS